MQSKTIRRLIATTVLTAGLSGAMAGTAHATREHIFLARSAATEGSASLSLSTGSDDPLEQNSSAVVSLGKLGRVE